LCYVFFTTKATKVMEFHSENSHKGHGFSCGKKDSCCMLRSLIYILTITKFTKKELNIVLRVFYH